MMRKEGKGHDGIYCGCEKSSFFRAITGLIRPDGGELHVLGQKPGWETNRGISYLPDRARWYPNHTVQQTLEWGQSFLPGFNMKDAHKLADHMDVEMELKMTGLSRGQEARVLLILCLAREVLLMGTIVGAVATVRMISHQLTGLIYECAINFCLQSVTLISLFKQSLIRQILAI
jgi:ABC-type nitrate/sulfonate/bicarbonate transport system ATPase subunit